MMLRMMLEEVHLNDVVPHLKVALKWMEWCGRWHKRKDVALTHER